MFVESVLRYGLSVDFIPIYIDLANKNPQKVLKALKESYGYLEDVGSQLNSNKKKSASRGASGDAFDMHEFSTLLEETYTPFPLFSVDWHFTKD